MNLLNTQIVKIDETNIDDSIMKEAGAVIKAGGLVAFPTETVYGLGGDALNGESSGKIYEAKGRPSDNPLIIHIAKMESLTKIVKNIPESAYTLAKAFWPGPLTMIFQKADCVPRATTGGLVTVAVRMPSNPIALALIEASGGYIAAPSANLSGKPSPTEVKYVIEDLNGRVDLIIDGGDAKIGLESTIIDLTSDCPMILRPGYITEEMLEKALGGVATDQTILDSNSKEAPKAPGMKYRHYAPKGSLTIVEGSDEKVIPYINECIDKQKNHELKTGVIATEETAGLYKADSIKSVGKRKDEASIARHLFSILREFDDEAIDVIFAESFEYHGIGQAIMNRLLKAAGHHVVKL